MTLICYYRIFLPRDKVHLQTSCMQRLLENHHLLNSLDPCKTQSTMATLLSIHAVRRQPGPQFRTVKQIAKTLEHPETRGK